MVTPEVYACTVEDRRAHDKVRGNSVEGLGQRTRQID
jgi:hypothetical protein